MEDAMIGAAFLCVVSFVMEMECKRIIYVIERAKRGAKRQRFRFNKRGGLA